MEKNDLKFDSSHMIRNNLTVISGYLDLLAMETKKPAAEQANLQKYIKIIKDEIKKIVSHLP